MERHTNLAKLQPSTWKTHHPRTTASVCVCICICTPHRSQTTQVTEGLTSLPSSKMQVCFSMFVLLLCSLVVKDVPLARWPCERCGGGLCMNPWWERCVWRCWRCCAVLWTDLWTGFRGCVACACVDLCIPLSVPWVALILYFPGMCVCV